MQLTLIRSTGDDMIDAGHTIPYDDTSTQVIDFTVRDTSQQTMLQNNAGATSISSSDRTLAVVYSGYSL